MLSVTSTELGVVLRKLRATYKQSFEQINISWKELRTSYLYKSKALVESNEIIDKLKIELNHKENQIRDEFDEEIVRLNVEFVAEKNRDKDILKQTELKMEQMSDTLKYLNGIFKAMQSDASTTKTADLLAKSHRLEKENKELLEKNTALEMVKTNLLNSEKTIKTLELNNKTLENEIVKLKVQLDRRDEVVNDLMEKEALRNAEIEKLQKISKLKDDELIAVDLKDPATSVLCIKCKKSLDDLSNIKSAIMGDVHGKGTLKYYCEKFRLLLPNLKGRRPNRTLAWVRSCMRCILISKMKEDVALQSIKGE
jgi:chromosome segregation ATPase